MFRLAAAIKLLGIDNASDGPYVKLQTEKTWYMSSETVKKILAGIDSATKQF